MTRSIRRGPGLLGAPASRAIRDSMWANRRITVQGQLYRAVNLIESAEYGSKATLIVLPQGRVEHG